MRNKGKADCPDFIANSSEKKGGKETGTKHLAMRGVVSNQWEVLSPSPSQNPPFLWAAQCFPYSLCPHHTVADLEPYPEQRQWQTFRPMAARHVLGRFLWPLGWIPTLSRGRQKQCLTHGLLFLENSWQTKLNK